MIKYPSQSLFLSPWKINFSQCSWYTRERRVRASRTFNFRMDSLWALIWSTTATRRSLWSSLRRSFCRLYRPNGKGWGLKQPALLMYDVFRGQTTDKFLDVLKDNNILSTKIPPNMTHVFQPLYLTVNKFAKDFIKGKFSTWFSRQISLGFENGMELDDIEVDYSLSVLKPLHAKWLVELYNRASTDIKVLNWLKRKFLKLLHIISLWIRLYISLTMQEVENKEINDVFPITITIAVLHSGSQKS